ncbi:MAG: hypothetical protein U1E45_15605 [Geminicoccaceae bacterium]
MVFGSAATDLVAEDKNACDDLFLRDRKKRVTRLITRAVGGGPTNGCSQAVGLIPDGRYLLFVSQATNLGPDLGGATAPQLDRLDLATGHVRLVGRNDGGEAAHAGPGREAGISNDGRVVAFWSNATNLVPNDTNGASDVFVRWLGQRHDREERSAETAAAD